MSDTWITDLTHFLGDDGELAEELPPPALNIASFVASIVAWVTARNGSGGETNVFCRRSPGRRRCRGQILAELGDGSVITWACPICGDNGVIQGWEGTAWDWRPAS